jgi:dsRNA-specific ribonuclease
MTENPKLEKLQKLIHYPFHDIHILEDALKRRAFLNETNPDSLEGSMNPLAVLGDAVLDLAIIQYFYEIGERDVGKITEMKSTHVKRKNTRKFAEKHNFKDFTFWGKGEKQEKIWDKGDKALDTVTEALLGAIFLDAQRHGENGMRIVEKILIEMEFFDLAIDPS